MFSEAVSSIKSATGIENSVLAAVPGLVIATGSLSARAVMAGMGYCCKGAAKYTSNEEYAKELGNNLIETSKSNAVRDMKIAAAVSVIGVAGVTINDYVNTSPELSGYEKFVNDYVVSTIRDALNAEFINSGIQKAQVARQSVQEKLPSFINDYLEMAISKIYWDNASKFAVIGNFISFNVKHPWVIFAYACKEIRSVIKAPSPSLEIRIIAKQIHMCQKFIGIRIL